MAALEVGAFAPSFELHDENGQAVSLADYKGKPVVLIFYPMDQTPGCTKQLCSARDDKAVYEESGIAIFGVNGGSEESHQKFIAKHKLTMPLLVDKGLNVASEYGAAMGFGPLKVINRTVVGVDPSGKIAYYQRGMPSTSEIIAAMQPTAK